MLSLYLNGPIKSGKMRPKFPNGGGWSAKWEKFPHCPVFCFVEDVPKAISTFDPKFILKTRPSKMDE